MGRANTDCRPIPHPMWRELIVERTNPKLARRAGSSVLPTSASPLLARRTSAALEAIGGAPKLLVPHKAKVAVIKACHFDPVVNRNYTEVAAAISIWILPLLDQAPSPGSGPPSLVRSSLLSRWHPRLGLDHPSPSEQQRARNAVSPRCRCDLARRL